MLIVVLFGFLNIKSVKIYAIPYIFAPTLLLYKLDTLLLKQKEFARIGYNGFLFPHSNSGDGLGATYLGLHLSTHAEKVISNTGRFFCFNSTVSYYINTSFLNLYITLHFIDFIIIDIMYSTFAVNLKCHFSIVIFHGPSCCLFVCLLPLTIVYVLQN